MNLPGSAKLHVWTGLLLALVGVLVGGYAYTGDRVYHIEFIAVAFGGFLLLVAGSILAGWGQANRPRLGEDPRNEEDSTSIAERIAALLDRGDEGERVEATLECPECREIFDAEGEPPFEATCPKCGHADRVEIPEPPEPPA